MMSAQIPAEFSDTSRYSYYVQPDFYEELNRLSVLFRDDWPECDMETSARVQSFLSREAVLVDNSRLNDWLELFVDECLYWVPITAGAGDPRYQVSHAFDDRRRLTDRVYWLRTGLAFSQLPASRTRRLITNVEVMLDEKTGALLVRSNFVIYEFRAGITKTYAGWYAHVLKDLGGTLRIQMKQANLLDSEQVHENLTLVF